MRNTLNYVDAHQHVVAALSELSSLQSLFIQFFGALEIIVHMVVEECMHEERKLFQQRCELLTALAKASNALIALSALSEQVLIMH